MNTFKQKSGETAREFAQRYLLHQIINLNFVPGQKYPILRYQKS